MNEYIKLFDSKEELNSATLGKPCIATSKDTDKVLFSSLTTKVTGDVTASKSVTAESIMVKGVDVSDDARLSLTATEGGITMKNSSFSGAFTSKPHAVVLGKTDNDIVVKDVDLSDVTTAYNPFEFWANTSGATSVLFENVKFGKATNNDVLVMATSNDATITFKNCDFGTCSNPIRLSNYTNATGVTLNIIDCTCDRWDDGQEGAPNAGNSSPVWKYGWAGLVCMEDFTSKSKEEVLANNLFGDGKITINVDNFIYDGQKLTMPEDISTLFGPDLENGKGILYIFNDYESTGSDYSTYFVTYSEETKNRFPNITIK